MANNIAQLKDYNDNNIFPIAGGMVANSVTTQMLQDGSVTSGKIDWATMAKNAYANNDRFTSDQSDTSPIQLLSTNYTSKTGRVCIIASGAIKTSANTSGLYIYINGDRIDNGAVTNSQTTATELVTLVTADIGASQTTIAVMARPQNNSTTVTVPAYIGFSLMIFDV